MAWLEFSSDNTIRLCKSTKKNAEKLKYCIKGSKIPAAVSWQTKTTKNLCKSTKNWPSAPTWSSAGVANKSIAIDRSIAECQLVDRAWFFIQLTRYIKRTRFNQYSRKYIKIIHQMAGHVYYLVTLAMAEHRLARPMPRKCCNIFTNYCLTIMI